MTRPKIKTALTIAFATIGFIFVGFAAFTLSKMVEINRSTEDIAGNWMPSLGLAKTADNAFTDMRLAWRGHVIASTKAAQDLAEADVQNARSAYLQALTDYERLAVTPAELEVVKNLRTTFAQYDKLAEQLRAASLAGDDLTAERMVFVDLKPFAVSINEGLSKLIGINERGASQSFADGQEDFNTSLYVALALLVFAAVCISGSIWFAIAGIAKPIQTITDAMKNLASGDVHTPIPYEGRADEIGDMAAAVDVFRRNAIETKRLEGEAQSQRHLTEEQQRRTAEQDRIRAEEMSQATQSLAEGLKELASGNLSVQLSQSFAQDFEGLRKDFNLAIEQLRQTLSTVAQATHAIDGGSREISASADDLSKRTEQQAASLEETAAALDQITTNVANSTKRAEEARAVAVQANEGARQSGGVVANAVNAMGRIEESSGQISNIIGVIDDIAFQTNLLALNAGVEAARAGEAGKGFAVVAQEVRELAQRSAQAAREIKSLISKSTVEVETGVKLVSETGEALKKIEGYIVTINQHMDAIATSAREQSVGLSEVNRAVNQMDQVTQQNAAMVEEASAAGATLANEANRMRELVSHFKLGTSPSDATGSHRPALIGTASANASVPSAPRSMVSKISRAFGGRGVAATAAAVKDDWQEF
ncbi:methyl-accepting chemotaxis protein [Rhizobium sp. SSA_523]|uniref:methyl-accepting chemotaxis protein n=1 Tax=Rhizobium sp. SSA_523 TaxID=2952477 RepID=UPI00209164E5|nr:methyl-accepting chemotaxis protein [Rhizobium sp. SSA_523]MCO5734805.1 methyl-accepting chemotaxis protein [Rhizobium sp. SSA_523]WKC21056.1 methyl-accepting chemotaxis protein [Rhizobium sp. SSA_523]